MNAGIGYVPSDRRQEGIIVNMPISQNTILANLDSYDGRVMLNYKKIETRVAAAIESLKIKCVSSSQEVMRLSGGNQQKVLLARWLLTNPDILILDEPTRGIDVGAKYEIYTIMLNLAKEGKSIIMISSEMPELMGMSNRVMIMCEGHVTGFLEGTDIDDSKIMQFASKVS